MAHAITHQRGDLATIFGTTDHPYHTDTDDDPDTKKKWRS